MELAADSFDWAHDAFAALNDTILDAASEKWAAFPPTPPSSEHGQITPTEDLSPAEPRHDSAFRESSIPAEQLLNELPLLVEQQMPALHDYQPTQLSSQAPPQSQQQSQDSPACAPKRRRTTKQARAPNQSQRAPLTSEQQTTRPNPQPPKRKRGRPRPQPQTIQAYTWDDIPFQVSSARQMHLEKNRVAANKCRQRRKEYINDLEARGREFSTKNQLLKESVAMLREEVLELKNEVLGHAGCNFWAVDKYLARCAGDLLRMDAPILGKCKKPSLTLRTLSKVDDGTVVKEHREMSAESLRSQGTTDSHEDLNDYFLRDFDEEIEVSTQLSLLHP